MDQGRIIVITGSPGTGKTTTASTVATVRVRADLHHIIKIETAKNGGNVKEVMDQALEEYIRKYLPDKL